MELEGLRNAPVRLILNRSTLSSHLEGQVVRALRGLFSAAVLTFRTDPGRRVMLLAIERFQIDPSTGKSAMIPLTDRSVRIVEVEILKRLASR